MALFIGKDRQPMFWGLQNEIYSFATTPTITPNKRKQHNRDMVTVMI